MPWFKVDDDFFSNPKVVEAGNAAVGLYVRCGSWSSKHLTEGIIPWTVARTLGSAREIARLVEVGLLLEATDSSCMYSIPDFLEYNPSRDEVEERRAARSHAGRLGGLAKQRASKAASKC